MAVEDKIKWDKKYSENIDLLEAREPSKAVVNNYKECSGNRALDLASGAGRNSLFLEDNGFEVDAVDISKFALDILQGRSKYNKINPILADLDEFDLGEERYDFIVKCNFLDRELIERAKRALKIGGVMVVETYVEDEENEKKNSNPNFLLKKDELLEIFKNGFEILEYKTFWNESFEKYRMKKASIVVKRLA